MKGKKTKEMKVGKGVKRREGKAGEIREPLLFASGASVEGPKGFSV